MRRFLLWKSTRTTRRVRLPLLRAEDGFTMIELLVSSLILVFIGAAVAEALIATAFFSSDQRRRSQASQLAQQDQERLRGLSVAQLNSLNTVAPRTVTVGGTAYTITSSSRFLNNTGGPSCIPGAAAYFKIDSSVNWAANKRAPVVVESIIAPPAGGTIRAQVWDQVGAGLPGVSVAANGPDYEIAPTDSNGCAVLSGLPTGNYNVTYGLTGYVDPDGNSSPPGITATVSSTGNAIPTKDPVRMGQAGSVTGTFEAPGSAGLHGEADTMSWYGAGSSLSMANSKSAQTSNGAVARSIASTAMFPFAFTGGSTPSYSNNYQVWAGACRQMQPPAGINQIGVAPGSTQSVTVQQPEVDLFVKNGTTRITPSHVKFSFSSTSGPSCNDSWVPTILPPPPATVNATNSTTGVLANPGQPFASPTTTGPNASASGYTGQTTVCVDNITSHKSANVNDSYSGPTSVTIDLSSGTSLGLCP
jgi:Tfp pilus assembly protein PilV